MSDNEHIQDLVLEKCQSLYWKRRTVYVERKNGASPKILGENFYKTAVATPKLTIDLLMENFFTHLFISFFSSNFFFFFNMVFTLLYLLQRHSLLNCNNRNNQESYRLSYTAPLQHLQSCT